MKICKAVIYIRVPTMEQAHDTPCGKKCKEILWEDIPDFARKALRNISVTINLRNKNKQQNMPNGIRKKTNIGKMERNGLMPPRFVFPYI